MYVYHGNLLLFTALDCQEHGSTGVGQYRARLAGELPFLSPLPASHDGSSPPDAHAAVPSTPLVVVLRRVAGEEGVYHVQT